MTKKLKIAYLLSYSSLFNLGPWRNSIQLMNQNGYEIIVYQYYDPKIHNDDFLNKHTLVQLHYPFILTFIAYFLKAVFRPLNKIGLSRISKTGDSIDYFINSFYFYFNGKNNKKLKQADIIIAGDPPSMVVGSYLARKSDKKLVFWELELLLTKELRTKAHKYFKKKEIEASKNIICALEFGEKRSELLRAENNISQEIPIFVIPNSTLGEPEIRREYYFNDYFKIPREKKIILAAGSVSNDFNEEMKRFWNSIQDWPDDWVFVMHSRVKLNHLHYPRIPTDLLNRKIFFHDVPLPSSMLNTIYSSCDIGLILIRLGAKMDSNLFYSEFSLGKLFHHLQNGRPVLARKIYGYFDFVDNNRIGATFNDYTEIFQNAQFILQNSKEFQLNCVSIFSKVNFRIIHLEFENLLKATINTKNG